MGGVLKISFFLGVVFSGIFLFSLQNNTALARIETGEPGSPSGPAPSPVVCPAPPPDPSTSWIETSCRGSSSACGGEILSRNCQKTYSPITDAGGCTTGWELTSSSCNTPISSSCGEYQACTGNSDWTPLDKPGAAACQCSGICYPAPNLKNLNDQTLSPKNIFEDSSTVKLPVTLGADKTVERDKEMLAESCKVSSYEYEISSGAASLREKGSSLYVPSSCGLKSGTSYSATAKACDTKGNCGKASDTLTFSTSAAPEPMSPANQTSASQPITLKWCPQANAKIYTLNVYQGKDLILPTGIPGSENFYDDENQWQIFQDKILYFWEIATCFDQDAKNCTPFSPLWSLTPTSQLSPPNLSTPENNSYVNTTDAFTWQTQNWRATHFLLRLSNNKEYVVQEVPYSLQKIWSDLQLNTTYTWKVASCGGTDFATCEDQSSWSKEFKFTTTGEKPTGLATKPLDETQTKTAIPATLFWNAMAGAASYAWEIAENTGVAINPEATIENIQRGTTYPWRVKTCADTAGTICGDWASSIFITATLAAPNITSPEAGKDEFIPSVKVSWNPVFSGNFYSYALQYLSLAPEEKSSLCKTGTVTQNIILQDSVNIDVRCMGQYQVQIAACIDSNCSQKGPVNMQTFSVKEPPAAGGGLVPCGRNANDPSTPWDEREPCQIKHIFLLFQNLISFVLWKLSVVIVALYAVATGVIFYTSFGGVETLAKVKSIWKAVGVGLAIMFFAWLFLNLLLGILGFNVNIFGRWYELPI